MNYQFRILRRQTLHQGFFRVEELIVEHELFAGGFCPPLHRELLDRGHAVVVLPIDPQRDEIVLVEQFRTGALDDPSSPWMLEAVAGIIEPGEGAEDVAHREGAEEAGLVFQELLPVGEVYTSPGGTTERVSIFCGRVDSSQAGGLHGVDQEHEDIRVQVFSREAVLAMLQRGELRSAPTVIAVQWLALHWQALKARWLGEG